MMKRMVVVLALTACWATAGMAQMGGTAPKVPAGTIIEPGKSIEALLNIYEEEIVGAAKAMPAEKYSFAPSQAIFAPSQKVDFASPKSVNTFGQTVAHIAQANYSFFSSLGGAKPVLAGEIGLTGGLGRIHEVVAYAARHHQVTRYDPQLAAFCGFAFYDVAGTDREPRRELRPLHSHDEFSVANLAGINLPEPVLP